MWISCVVFCRDEQRAKEELLCEATDHLLDASAAHMEAGVSIEVAQARAWPPFETGWRPGMDEPRTRYVAVHGPPVLTKADWNRLADLDPEEIRQRIAAHFGDDPQSWISPTADW